MKKALVLDESFLLFGSPGQIYFETNTTGNRNDLRPARVLTGKYRRSRL
jgi:hypothetical protein